MSVFIAYFGGMHAQRCPLKGFFYVSFEYYHVLLGKLETKEGNVTYVPWFRGGTFSPSPLRDGHILTFSLLQRRSQD